MGERRGNGGVVGWSGVVRHADGSALTDYIADEAADVGSARNPTVFRPRCGGTRLSRSTSCSGGAAASASGHVGSARRRCLDGAACRGYHHAGRRATN